MKRCMKGFLVVVMCMVFTGGLAVPVSIPGNSSVESTVVTIQAKKKINSKFKKAMDEYLKFYKKYAKFMKKYKKSSNIVAMMSDYSKMLKQQTKLDKAFKKWKKTKLNSAELAYYTTINTKVLTILSSIN